MLDTDDDDNSSVSSSSTMKSDRTSVLGTEEVQLDKDSLLEQALDALYEKRLANYYFWSFQYWIKLILMLFDFVGDQGFDKRESFGINY